MRQAIAEKVKQHLPTGWACRSGIGTGDGLPYWLIVPPDGQVRSLMGLHRLSEQQLENRIKGVVSRAHLGAHAK